MSAPAKDSKPRETSDSSHEWIDVVMNKIQNLRFGSVQITVHEGRVTQVESLEKTRFNADDDSLAAPRKPRRN